MTRVERLIGCVQQLQAVLEEQRPHLTQAQRQRVHDACSKASEVMAEDIAETMRKSLPLWRRIWGRGA